MPKSNFLRTSLAAPLLALGLLAACSEQPSETETAAQPDATENQEGLGGVLIIGGTRGVGLEMVRELNARNEKVVVLVRPTSKTGDLEVEEVPLIVGDAMDRPSIDAAVASDDFSIVVTTINGRLPNGERADAQGNVNIIDAAKVAGIDRLVLISTIGAGDSRGAVSDELLNVLAGAIGAKNVAEEHLKDSGLDYTIVRPGGLVDKAANGKGVLLQDPTVNGVIGRTELAKIVIDTFYDDAALNQTYSAIESDGTQ